ncbi:hypothetical protein Tco_0092319 [Tanacetum coccineum]
MASMNPRLNIEKLYRNNVQNHGGSKQVGFKKLGHDVKNRSPWSKLDQRKLEVKQLEVKTNMACLVKEQAKVHLGIHVEADIMVTGVRDQDGAEVLGFEVLTLDEDIEYEYRLRITTKEKKRREEPCKINDEFMSIARNGDDDVLDILGLDSRYGYCKNLKKTVKTRQTRTRERNREYKSRENAIKGSISRNGDDDVLDIVGLDSSILGMKVQSNEGKALVKFRIWARVEGFDYAYDGNESMVNVNGSKRGIWFYEFSDEDSQVGKKGTFCSGVIFCLRRNILGGKSLCRNH